MVDRHYDRRGHSDYHDPRRDIPPRRVSFEDRPRDRSRSPPRKIARQSGDRLVSNNSSSSNCSPRKSQTFPATNARGRSPELFVPSPAPIQAERTMSPNVSEKQQTTRRSADVKGLCVHLAETVYYSIQQDTAEKKYKKVQNQAERYRETDFNSAMEVVDQQATFADQERRRAAKQHSAAIRKLQEEFVQYHKNLQSDLSEDLAYPASVGSSLTMDDIDGRLEEFRESLTASIEEKVAQKAQSDRQLLSQEFESSLSSMGADVEKTVARNDALEKRLEEMLIAHKHLEGRVSSLQKDIEAEKTLRLSLERKLKDEMSKNQQGNDKRPKGLGQDIGQSRAIIIAEVDKKIAGLTKRVDSAECSIKNAAAYRQKQHCLQDQKSDNLAVKIGELSTRLLTTAARVNEFDKELSMLKQDASKSPKTPPRTPTPNDSLHSGLQNTLAEAERRLEQIKSVQNCSSQQMSPLNEDQFATILDKRIAQTRKETQSTLTAMANKFGVLIDEERAARGQLETRAQEIEKVVVSTSRNITASVVDSRFRDLDAKYATILAAQDCKVAVVSDLLNKTRNDIKVAFEDYTMQLGNLTSWQNNWNTTELYLQIVNHINATYPQGVFNELSKVSKRLEYVEVRLKRNHDNRQSPMAQQQSLANMTPSSDN